jgi:hypothetical protein
LESPSNYRCCCNSLAHGPFLHLQSKSTTKLCQHGPFS